MPRLPKSTAQTSLPSTFTTYQDPQGRFELNYPTEWMIHVDDGVHVASIHSGLFVRVDHVPHVTEIWSALARDLERKGIALRHSHHGNGRDQGELLMDARQFAWEGFAYPTHDGVVILTLARSTDIKRGKAMELYSDVVLSRIRRHFAVFPKEVQT